SFEMVYTKPLQAQKKALQALQLAQKKGFKQGEASSYSRLGIYYDVVGKFDSAIYCYKKSLQICKSIQYLKGQGAASCNLGLVYLNQNEYTQSLKYLHQAVGIFEITKNYVFLGHCYKDRKSVV